MQYCEFLKTAADIKAASDFLTGRDLVPHITPHKNWDLAHVFSHDLSTCDVLDMGSSGSYVLMNAGKGRKIGIDLRPPDKARSGVEYLVGDLCHTPLPAKSVDFITCLSVIEHGVEFKAFTAEVARLLRPQGKAVVTFDYWHPRFSPVNMKAYGLPWKIFDRLDVETLITHCKASGLELMGEIDWRLQDKVVGPAHTPFRYCYTFGCLTIRRCVS